MPTRSVRPKHIYYLFYYLPNGDFRIGKASHESSEFMLDMQIHDYVYSVIEHRNKIIHQLF